MPTEHVTAGGHTMAQCDQLVEMVRRENCDLAAAVGDEATTRELVADALRADGFLRSEVAAMKNLKWGLDQLEKAMFKRVLPTPPRNETEELVEDIADALTTLRRAITALAPEVLTPAERDGLLEDHKRIEDQIEIVCGRM